MDSTDPASCSTTANATQSDWNVEQQLRDVADLRRRGFAVCKPDPKTKSPTYNGWPTRSLEAADFGPGDQVGIIGGPLSDGNKPGHALVIVDLDAADALAKADQFLPKTSMVEGRPLTSRNSLYRHARFAGGDGEARDRRCVCQQPRREHDADEGDSISWTVSSAGEAQPRSPRWACDVCRL